MKQKQRPCAEAVVSADCSVLYCTVHEVAVVFTAQYTKELHCTDIHYITIRYDRVLLVKLY